MLQPDLNKDADAGQSYFLSKYEEMKKINMQQDYEDFYNWNKNYPYYDLGDATLMPKLPKFIYTHYTLKLVIEFYEGGIKYKFFSEKTNIWQDISFADFTKQLKDISFKYTPYSQDKNFIIFQGTLTESQMV